MKFWTHLLELLRIYCKLSSSYHPQTNGRTECTNQTLEQYLHYLVNYQQDDQMDFLHMAEFDYNIQSILLWDGKHEMSSSLDDVQISKCLKQS